MPSPTLIDDLRSALSVSPSRPILHHLNADTSWLIQLPIPSPSVNSSSASSTTTASPTPPSRRYYNILLDPWLSGSQSDVASWFSQQWHAITSAYSSIAAVQALCEAAEKLDDPSFVPIIPTSPPGHAIARGGEKEAKWNGVNYIDAVAISHEFTDHCHRQTLEELPKNTHVFAWSKAAKMIKGWKWFEAVHEVKGFESDWRETSGDPLPPWLGIGRLYNESDGLYYHSALVISFDLSPTSSPSRSSTPSDTLDSAECIIYTPHGLHPPTLAPIPLASPPLRPLALLHGLHDVSLDWRQQLNLGGHNGLAVQRMLGAKYWFATHDEEKTGKGVVSWFLRRKKVSLDVALEKEEEGVKGELGRVGRSEGEKWDEKEERRESVGWRELGNGELIVLKRG